MATVSAARPTTRFMGARIRRVRKRLHAAATRSSGRSAAASPNDWNIAAATFAPSRPVQLRADAAPADTHEGSFGLYETRHSVNSSPTANSAMAMISLRRVFRGFAAPPAAFIRASICAVAIVAPKSRYQMLAVICQSLASDI